MKREIFKILLLHKTFYSKIYETFVCRSVLKYSLQIQWKRESFQSSWCYSERNQHIPISTSKGATFVDWDQYTFQASLKYSAADNRVENQIAATFCPISVPVYSIFDALHELFTFEERLSAFYTINHLFYFHWPRVTKICRRKTWIFDIATML